MVKVTTGQPFTLPDGTVIHPGDGVSGRANTIERNVISLDDPVDEDVTIDESIIDDDPFEQGLTFKRTLADVPANPKRMNPVMLVLAYHMWGLDSTAIGMLLQIDTEQVDAVISDDMFIAMRRGILEAIRYAEAGSIHGYLSQQSLKAVRKVVGHMNGKNADRSLLAAKDILDRSGYRPSDRVEHVHRFEDELRIVYVKEQTMPTIDLNLKEITNGHGS